jgi:hypothetical protein
MNIRRWIMRVALALALPAWLAACGGGSGSADGSLRVALTDAPACGFDAVNVTVQKVRIHQSPTAAETDGGWTDITLSPAQRFDLLSLQNGALAELGQTPLAPGRYQQMRLVLASNDSTPLANSVTPTGGSEVALTTPSGQQTGLKMNVDITVASNQLADVVIDFNACKSVVATGSGKYLLKPVLSVTPRFISGVQGFVDASLANGNTLVTLQQAGVVVRATSPNSTTGNFLLQPVAAGTYDLVITAPGHATEVLTGVPVVTDTVTAVNTSTTAFTLPASTGAGTAAGTVTTGAAPIDATVRALQTLTGGPTVEIVSAPVNATTGKYAYTLVVDAPLKAAYVSGSTPSFVADAAAAGKYSIEASSGGVTKPTVPNTIIITNGVTVTTDFTFP